jgi:hypothetical protein
VAKSLRLDVDAEVAAHLGPLVVDLAWAADAVTAKAEAAFSVVQEGLVLATGPVITREPIQV